MPVNPEDVRKSLQKCMDPEVPLNIVEMGLIYGIDVDGGDVDIRMTMTTRGCPLHEDAGTRRDTIRKEGSRSGECERTDRLGSAMVHGTA